MVSERLMKFNMLILIGTVIVLVSGCTSKNGPGRYEIDLNDIIKIDDSLSLEYGFEDGVGNVFYLWKSLYKNGQKLQRIQTCIPSENDILNLQKPQNLAPYFFNTFNPKPFSDEIEKGGKCYVDIFRIKDFSSNSLELSSYEGFECGNTLVGFVFKKGGFNPYELHGFNTITAQRQVDFAQIGNEVLLCKDVKIVVENFDGKNRKITLTKK